MIETTENFNFKLTFYYDDLVIEMLNLISSLHLKSIFLFYSNNYSVFDKKNYNLETKK